MTRPTAAAVAALTGFAVMALELTAVRLMAPHFGDSAYVWTNVELEWEEHHYIEARYWASSDRLRVTVNGDAVFDGPVGPAHGPVRGAGRAAPPSASASQAPSTFRVERGG